MEPALAGEVPGDLFLHVPGVAGPAWVGAAERRNKMEPGILARHLFELVAVQDVRFVAHPEQQPDFRRVGLLIEVLQHGADGRDAGPGGDEGRYGVGRLAQREQSERALKPDGIARLQMKKPRGNEAMRDDVQAQVKPVVVVRRGGDGVRPNALFAVDFDVHGNELAGLKVELAAVLDFEFKMLGPVVGVPDVAKMSDVM